MTREEFIKRKIKEKGVTLKDYARMINMPYSTLLSMLAGNLGGASLDNVVRICNGLDTNIGVLQSPNMDPSAENGMSNLSEREKNWFVSIARQAACRTLWTSCWKSKTAAIPKSAAICKEYNHPDCINRVSTGTWQYSRLRLSTP